MFKSTSLPYASKILILNFLIFTGPKNMRFLVVSSEFTIPVSSVKPALNAELIAPRVSLARIFYEITDAFNTASIVLILFLLKSSRTK